MNLLRLFITDQVTLSRKEKIISILACFCSIFSVAIITQRIAPHINYPIIVASMGASAAIIFIIPSSPLAQPWPFIGGHIISAMIGVGSSLIFTETYLAAGFAAAGSILFMLALRCLHPPGAATALAPIMSGGTFDFSFVLTPVAVNTAIMLFMVLLINRWVLKRNYPAQSCPNKKETVQKNSITINEDDLKQALIDYDSFVDINHADLQQLINLIEINSFKRIHGNITCKEIMMTDITTVEYGTSVEEAWQIMHAQKLKAIPVIDKSKRVIGIITWHDFFKFINLSAYDTFQDKFRSFIRRTPTPNTNKPESVGHIMTSSVVVLPDSTHIADLIPLMSTFGHRQIPIVDNEQRLTGMVNQAILIAALYNLGKARQNN